MPMTSQGLNLPHLVRVRSMGGDHDDGDNAELCAVQALGEEHKGQKIAGDKVIDHVTADGAERKSPEVSFGDLVFVHLIISFHVILSRSFPLGKGRGMKRWEKTSFFRKSICDIGQEKGAVTSAVLDILRS